MGQILLRSTDPLDKPIIQTNYLSDERDLQVLREGLKLSRKLASAPAFDKYRGEEVFPGKAVQTNEELEEYIRKVVVHTIYLTDSLHSMSINNSYCSLFLILSALIFNYLLFYKYVLFRHCIRVMHWWAHARLDLIPMQSFAQISVFMV